MKYASLSLVFAFAAVLGPLPAVAAPNGTVVVNANGSYT